MKINKLKTLVKLLGMYILIGLTISGVFQLGRFLLSNPGIESSTYAFFLGSLEKKEVASVTLWEQTDITSNIEYKTADGQRYEVKFVETNEVMTDVKPYAETVVIDSKRAMTPFETTVVTMISSGFITFFIYRLWWARRMAKRQLKIDKINDGNVRIIQQMPPMASMQPVEEGRVGRTVESQTKLADVAGCEEEKQEVLEIIDFLKHPKRYAEMGASIPKGVLLVGPPGTGKTLLAKAIAGEAGVTFLHASGSEFVEKYVGVGAKRVRSLFEEAKEKAPAILFIDEIDAIGRQRSNGEGNQEHEQTLNQFLVELDGMDKNNGVIVLGATNRPEVLDKAFLRKGRFDRKVAIDLPNTAGRKEILMVHAKNKKLDASVNLDEVANKTHGFSGADLFAVLNEAALMAVRNKHKSILMEDIDEGIDRVMMGHSSKSKKYGRLEKHMVAYHESGHVVLGLKLCEADQVDKVTIIPRGNAGGYAMLTPKEDRFLTTKEALTQKICGLLAGRCAEEMMFNTVTTGATNDLERASSIARSMVTQYAMSDLGLTQLEQQSAFYSGFNQVSSQYSPQTALAIDKEVEKILQECYAKTKTILEKNQGLLQELAETLLTQETLNKQQIEMIEEKHKEETDGTVRKACAI